VPRHRPQRSLAWKRVGKHAAQRLRRRLVELKQRPQDGLAHLTPQERPLRPPHGGRDELEQQRAGAVGVVHRPRVLIGRTLEMPYEHARCGEQAREGCGGGGP